jgi:hypothetical protein
MGESGNMLLPGLLPNSEPNPANPAVPGQPSEPAQPKKKNFFQRLFGGGSKQNQPPSPEPPQQ